MPAPHFKPINLVPPSEFELSFWGRFLKWGVSSGRYILIVTEMLVIAAFLFEFKLNDDLDNLNQTLEGQKNILQSLAPAEEKFRQVQARINSADEMIKGQMEVKELIDSVVNKIPPEVKLDSLNILGEEMLVRANTISQTAMGTMVERLAADNRWKDVRVTSLTTENSELIKFTLQLDR